ncbi:MAG: DUF2752 domain-containing protein [Oscillospiraceae bacterium]|nr:DUF2752 domain-containing protein [Oscillospiraceae bacterium]
MVNPWHNLKNNIKKHLCRLYSFAGAAFFFCILSLLTIITNGHSLCIFYNLFRIKCIGCGMTRAFISILQLDFITASNYNKFSIPLFFGIAFYCILLVIDILFGKETVTVFERVLSKKYMYFIYLSVFIISVYLMYFCK